MLIIDMRASALLLSESLNKNNIFHKKTGKKGYELGNQKVPEIMQNSFLDEKKRTKL